jgi:tripartite-type tricarboxylate transporter receptor subunit TctC
MKKRFVTLLLALVFIVAGCGQSNQTSGGENSAGISPSAGEKKSDYPNKPITMIIPYDAGGATDLNGRILANGVNKYLPNGQTVVVENKPGGQGSVGLTELAKVKPDGYTIGFTSISPITVNPHIMQTAYTPEDFHSIMGSYKTTMVFVVRKDSPWETFDQWLTYVKENPGKFNYGTNGVGSTAHLAMEMLNLNQGLEMKHVPFKGAAPALTALLGGHVQGTLLSSTQTDMSELRILANFGSSRNNMFPDAKTLKELGIDAAADINTGILAPKGLPEDVYKVLEEAFRKAIEDPEVIAEFKKLGTELSYQPADEFKQTILDNYDINGKVIEKLGLGK